MKSVEESLKLMFYNSEISLLSTSILNYNRTATMNKMEDILNAHPTLKLSFMLRLGMIQKESLPQLSDEQFFDALMGMKWRGGIPMKFHEVINDIFQLSADEIVAYLSKKAIIDARKNNLDEFAAYFGGKS